MAARIDLACEKHPPGSIYSNGAASTNPPARVPAPPHCASVGTPNLVGRDGPGRKFTMARKFPENFLRGLVGAIL
jgi:hypothetical protein